VVQALLSPHSLSCSQHPAIGARPQVVPLQVAGLQAELGQGVQDDPQWAGSSVLTHALPHWWKPASQVKPQVLLAQVAMAWGGASQACSQAPQLAGSLRMSCSQPLSGSPSQFANPVSHAPSVHVPPWQVALAWAKPHAVPHSPQ
jgi:hypothetical protein